MAPEEPGSIEPDEFRVVESEAPNADVRKGFSRKGSFKKNWLHTMKTETQIWGKVGERKQTRIFPKSHQVKE